MKHEDLTKSILSCAFAVSWELGTGFLESVYENALFISLTSKGHQVEQQKALRVRFRNAPVGIFFADLVVDATVIVELKAAKALTLEHEAQVIHYLKASGMDVGLLLNFGNPRLEIRRLSRSRPPAL